jgi:hypothetical protein
MTILQETCDLSYHLFPDRFLIDLNRRVLCEVVDRWCSCNLLLN